MATTSERMKALRTSREAVQLREAAKAWADPSKDIESLAPWRKLEKAALVFAAAHAKAVKPPRVVYPKPGPCGCDAPKKAHEVRRMKVCPICELPGLDLIRTGRAPMHARCIFTAYISREAIYQLATSPDLGRVRMCCLPGPLLSRVVAEARRKNG